MLRNELTIENVRDVMTKAKINIASFSGDGRGSFDYNYHTSRYEVSHNGKVVAKGTPFELPKLIEKYNSLRF